MQTFNALSEVNQARAIEDIRADEFYLDYEWYDTIKDDFLTILEILGYYDIKTYFSGFYSQGDGASFKAKYSYERGSLKEIIKYAPQDEELHRIAKELKEMQSKACYDIGATITTYSHEMTMRADMYSYNGRILDDTAEQYEDSFLELSRDLARWYYKRLEEEYDYLMSDEAIREHLIANEMEFDYEDNK